MISILLATAQAVAPAPLAPQGSWTVAYEQTMCLASRKFGPNGEVELLLRPSPLGNGLEITFIEKGSTNRRAVFDGDAHVQAGPGGARKQVGYKAWRSASQNGRVLIASASQSLLDELTDDGWLSFDAAKETTFRVQTQQFAKLKSVLADCKRKVALHQGVDLASLNRISAPADPIGNPARWLTNNDYPAEALRSNKSGLVTILYRVGLTGAVEDCRVIETSGVPSLETATCRAIKRNAKFKPARDHEGKSMTSWEIRRVWWVTPAGG
jgi:TonB family protein